MKKIIISALAGALCMFLVLLLIATLSEKKEPELTADEILERFENALGDEYKKQTVSEVIAQLTYAHKDGGNPIYYYFVKTTYYEADPAEVTGLNTDAFRTVFNPDSAETAEEMMIQDWHGALYKKDDTAYLCWTVDPEVSYVLEYTPSKMSDSEIIKMAESAAPMEEKTEN